jgi:hypothetical protein
MTDSEYRPVWENRRKVIFGSLYFCALVEIMLLAMAWFGVESSAMLVTIAGANKFLATAVIGSYVWGATWEDISLWKP